MGFNELIYGQYEIESPEELCQIPGRDNWD